VILFIFSILIALIYDWWAISVYKGWKRYLNSEQPSVPIEQGISIVIAFRNEAKNLPALLRSLAALNYPSEKVEFILVNDNSEDRGVQIVENWLDTNFTSAKLLHGNSLGKKAAQYLGIQNATFEIIACTDADCELPKAWLKRINESFIDTKTELAFGAVEIAGENHALQQLEFLALIGSTIGMLQKDWAVMGNAANMAFRKQSYLDVFPTLEKTGSASGDDVFLLHEVAKKQRAIAVLAGKDSVVKTLPQADFKSLFSQRLRWASKARLYSSKIAIAVAVLIFAVNSSLLLQLLAALHFTTSFVGFVFLFAVKLVADYFLLRSFARFYEQPIRIEVFLLQEIINIIYVPTVAVLSQFVRFTWKGRKY